MRSVAHNQPAQAATASDATALVLSFMLAAAGLAHLSVTPAHFGEWWLSGVLFLLSTLLQLGLAAALLLRPSRAAVATAVVVCVGLIATWALSRTSGLPFGPDSGSPEAIGALDVLTTAIEVAFVAAGLAAMAPAGARLPRSQTACQSVGVALGILLTVAFAGGVGHG